MATVPERLDRIDEKMAQLKRQRQALVAKENQKARKARTRRLIQNGALAEQYLRGFNLPPGEFEKLLLKVVNMAEVRSFLASRP